MIKHHKARDSSGTRNIAILCAVIAVLYLARELLIPFAFAVTLSMILTPAVALLEKLHLRRVPAALLVVVIAMACAGGVGWVIFNQLVDVANQLPGYRENINKKIEAMHTPGKGALGRAAASVKELGQQLSSQPASSAPSTSVVPSAPNDRKGRRIAPNPTGGPVAVQIVEDPDNELQYVGDLIKPFLKPFGVFGMVLIFSVFLLIEHNDLRNKVFRLVGIHQLNVMTQALNDAGRRVSRYLLLQILVNAGFGVLCATGLYFIGVPYAALWGTVATILRLVPYVGSLVAAALPFMLSLAVFDHWMPPLLIFLLFGGLELVISNFMEPWLYGMHTGISSLALLISTVFWAVLWGSAGLILSTPLTVCVVVLGRYVPQFSFLHILLGDEVVLVAEAQIYQRLLAMDNLEARAVADRYLKEHSLVQLYDSVLIPALTMAEHDRHKDALYPAREEFLFLSIKEMLAELSENSPRSEPVDTETASEASFELTTGRMFCLPANDEADEITAAMLAQLLERAGCLALSFPVDSGLLQLLQVLEPAADDVFYISSLPPFAFAHARTLSVQLRTRFPRTRIVVGIWGFTGETERVLERFQAPRPDQLVTSLEQALDRSWRSGLSLLSSHTAVNSPQHSAQTAISLPGTHLRARHIAST
jgi:predicted PurR-regulated permease PerM